jgi:hypothetical protein
METEGMMVYFLRRVITEVSDIVIGRQTGNVLPAFGVLRTLILPLCNPTIPFTIAGSLGIAVKKGKVRECWAGEARPTFPFFFLTTAIPTEPDRSGTYG